MRRTKKQRTLAQELANHQPQLAHSIELAAALFRTMPREEQRAVRQIAHIFLAALEKVGEMPEEEVA